MTLLRRALEVAEGPLFRTIVDSFWLFVGLAVCLWLLAF
jgi:hypothetical protein